MMIRALMADTRRPTDLESRLDYRTRSRIEVTRTKENASRENRKNAEAQRGSDTAKSVQYGIVTRLARLANRHRRSPMPCEAQTAPRAGRLFGVF
jgi:hypothetical protein